MSDLFRKLNLKDHNPIVVVNARSEFEPLLAALTGPTIARSLDEVPQLSFALLFVTMQHEVDALAQAVAAKAQGDAVIWFAYPKGSSKRYTCEFNRDSGWGLLGALGFEPVRQVAIDADWSALRFRRVEYIKTLTRRKDFAISDAGRARTSGE